MRAEQASRLRHPAGRATEAKQLTVARQGALLGIQVVANAVAGAMASTVALAASAMDGVNPWLRLGLGLVGLANLGVVAAWLRHGTNLLRAHLPVIREHKTNTKRRSTK